MKGDMDKLRNEYKWLQILKMGFIALITVYLATSHLSVNIFKNNFDTSQTESIKYSIEKAAVQCYALEGYYPPNLKYLEVNYGIKIDKTKYHCEYLVFSSNVKPQINVFERKSSNE